MCVIEEFRIFPNKKGFVWKFNGKDMKKKFQHPIHTVIELNDKSGFAIIANEKEYGSHNGLILNGNGTLRLLLEIPFGTEQFPFNIYEFPCFCDIYYCSSGRLEIFISGNNALGIRACTVDEKTGELTNFHETR